MFILVHRYYANTETYLKAVALKRMPPNLQTVDMLKAGEVYSLSICMILNNSCMQNPAISMHWQMMACPLTSSLITVYCNVNSVPEPCLDSFVFLRVKERQENILVEPETDDQRYV